jgi:threonine aldolase
MSYCDRGNQVILEKDSHIAWSQEWGLSYICGLYPKIVAGEAGVMNPRDIEAAITESKFKHSPKTDLVCLENSHNLAGGTVMTKEQTDSICEVAHRHGARVFVDGCRLFYSAAAQKVEPSELVAQADGVFVSMIKGICGHGGAVLAGTAKDMAAAQLNLKRIGAASFHRAGMLAASDIVAVETMRERLEEDIRRARTFASALSVMRGVEVNLAKVQTNIVMVDISPSGMDSDAFIGSLMDLGIKALKCTDDIVRFTFHRHIGDEDVDAVVGAIDGLLRTKARMR